MWESGSWVCGAFADMLEAAAEKISVAGGTPTDAERRERNGVEKAGHGGQRIEADFLADVQLDDSQTAIFQRGRKAASVQVLALRHRHEN